MRRSRAGLLALPLFLAAAPVSGQGAGQAGEIPFEKYRLNNGLEVILAPDPSVPTVAVDVWYDVGSRNERRGKTGFAHLFEHMMFEGSQNVAKGEHMKLLSAAGSSNYNGTTGPDRTNYYQVVPPNRINLALWLEADRMRSLNVSEENLENQQEVVKEEKRMRVDNAPYATSFRRLISEVTFNPATCFAYGHIGIGSMEDLEASSLDDVRRFFRTYYAPNNATLVVAGDFDPAQVKAMIEERFGGIPAAAPAPPVECSTPFSHLPVRETVVDRNANLPAVMMGYGAVPAGHPDSYALELLGSILAGGESARFNQRLVQEERAALNAISFPFLQKDAGALVVYVIANQGVGTERLEQLVDAEFAKVRSSGVTAAELTRAKNQLRSGRLRTLLTSLGRAEALQQADFYYGDPAAISSELEKYAAVTREDIQRVAQKYLVPANRAVIIVQTPATEKK